MNSTLNDQVKTAVTNAAVTALMADQAAEAAHEVKEVKLGDVVLHSVPQGRTLQSTEAYLAHPYRIKGTEAVNDAPSLLLLTRRYDKAPRLMKFSKKSLLVQCVVNAHTMEQPGWCDHLVQWQLKQHRDLLAWMGICGRPLSQVQFMEFLEDHVVDITDKDGGPSQSVVQSVIGDLQLTTDAQFQAKRDLSNGNFVLHNSSTSKPNVEVPQKFSVGLPIYDGLDISYVLPLRLRYSVSGEGALTFRVAFVNLDAAMDEAWDNVVESITGALPDEVPFIHVPFIHVP